VLSPYTPLPSNHRNCFGGTLGRPLTPRFSAARRFFFNYEGLHYPIGSDYETAHCHNPGANGVGTNNLTGINMFADPSAVIAEFRLCVLGIDTSCGGYGYMRPAHLEPGSH